MTPGHAPWQVNGDHERGRRGALVLREDEFVLRVQHRVILSCRASGDRPDSWPYIRATESKIGSDLENIHAAPRRHIRGGGPRLCTLTIGLTSSIAHAGSQAVTNACFSNATATYSDLVLTTAEGSGSEPGHARQRRRHPLGCFLHRQRARNLARRRLQPRVVERRQQHHPRPGLGERPGEQHQPGFTHVQRALLDVNGDHRP